MSDKWGSPVILRSSNFAKRMSQMGHSRLGGDPPRLVASQELRRRP
jgi:hypothetical protein